MPRPSFERVRRNDHLGPTTMWGLATVAMVGAIGGFSLWLGPSANAAPWDTFGFLNEAYRINAGQAPSSDFSNPIGPLMYGLIALGMHLQSVPSLRAVTYGSLMFAVVASALAWTVTRSRVTPAAAAAFTVFVALMSTAVRPLGYSPATLSYAMLYNRFGWLLYATLLLLVLLPRRVRATPREATADAVLLGVVLGLLFYCKINFFLVGLVAVGFGMALVRTAPPLRLVGYAVGAFAAVGLGAWLLFRVSVVGYLGDLATAAESQSRRSRITLLLHECYDSAIAVGFVLLVLGLYVVRYRRETGGAVRDLLPDILSVVFVLGSCIVISSGDAAEHADLPALVVAPLVIAARSAARDRAAEVVPGSRRSTRRRYLSQVLIMMLVLLTAGPLVVKDTVALSNSADYRQSVRHPPAEQRFRARGLHDFLIPADATWQTAYRASRNVPAMLNGGMDLLRRHIQRTDIVVTLAATDPFSFPLNLPTGHGPLWWDAYFNFNKVHYPAASTVFGDAGWIMIPRMVAGQGCCQYTVKLLLSIYAAYIGAHFVPADRTGDWILLQRAPGATGH